MKNLIIIGAGGMGRSYYDLARESIGYDEEFAVKGFIDDNIKALDGFSNYPPLLGRIIDYVPKQEDVFISSIGGNVRKDCVSHILSKGGIFINLVHRTARLGTNAELGVGNLIGAFTVIGSDARLGAFNMIQSYTVIGHDVIIGDFNRIDTHVTCVGGVVIKDNVTVHTSSVINHGVVLEADSKVAACSFVIRKVKEGTTVWGIPAKKLNI